MEKKYHWNKFFWNNSRCYECEKMCMTVALSTTTEYGRDDVYLCKNCIVSMFDGD